MFVSAQTMQRQIEDIARTREIVSLSDARRILAEPPGTRRRDAFVVTFDDGYADNHHVAMPVLAAMKVPATFFVATGYTSTSKRFPHDRLFASLTELARRGIPVERAGLPGPVQSLLSACAEPAPAATLERLIARLAHDRLMAIADALEARTGLAEQDLPDDTRAMTWEELAELRAAGMDVGGHTVNHAVLSNLPLPAARHEIVGCHEMIAERLGSRRCTSPTRTATTRRPCGARSPRRGSRPGSPPRTGRTPAAATRTRCPERCCGRTRRSGRSRTAPPSRSATWTACSTRSGSRAASPASAPTRCPPSRKSTASAKERAAS